MSECLFCRIVRGELTADIVHRTDSLMIFRDIAPQAPVHLVAIPTEHHVDAGALAAEDPGAVGALVTAADQVARLEGLTDYRLVFNSGALAGQSVFHVHLHLLGGRAMGWPPG